MKSIKKGLLLLLVLLAGIISFIYFSREPSVVPPCFVVSSPSHHYYKPNCEGRFVLPHRTALYRFNELGLRDRPVSDLSPYRIMLMGDSDVEGHGVEVEATYARILEAKANLVFPRKNETPPLAVINAGIRFSGPVFQALRIQKFVPILEPKKLIWFLSENDMSDDRLFESLAKKRDAGGFPIEFSTADFDEAQIQLPKLFQSFSNSYFITRLRRFLYGWNVSKMIRSVPLEATHSCMAIDRVKKFLDERGIPLAVVIIPLGPNNPNPKEPEEFKTILKCFPESVPVLDFREVVGREKRFYQDDDTHLNEEAINLVAQKIFESLPEYWKVDVADLRRAK